jgi:hypothetical protein
MMNLVVAAAEFSPFSRARGFSPQPENCECSLVTKHLLTEKLKQRGRG